MRLLYIHIGMHKTGTTSVQWYLARHARRLRGYGFHVPRAGRLSQDFAGHHNVAWSVLRDGRLLPDRGTLDAVLDELERARAFQAILSSEEFEFLADRPEDLMRFDGRLHSAGWLPVYLLFLRNQASYALSVFEELKKHDNPVAFEAFCDEVLAGGTYRSRRNHLLHLDYDLFISKWRAAARGELRVLSYDQAAAGPGIIPSFMRAIGAPARLGELRQVRANTGSRALCPRMQEAARRIEHKFLPSLVRHVDMGARSAWTQWMQPVSDDRFSPMVAPAFR